MQVNQGQPNYSLTFVTMQVNITLFYRRFYNLYSTITEDLITAARELFSHTTVPDTFWLDGKPQFCPK